MYKKISVDVEVSQNTDTINIDLQDLGFTEKQWNALDEGARQQSVEEYLDSLSEQPYWVVVKINQPF